MKKFQMSNFKCQISNKNNSVLEIGNWKLEIPDPQAGQAMVMLLFFTIIAMIITASAVAIIATNALSESRLQQGFSTLDAAEGGAENAMLRLLRDPNYTGETMSVGSANVVIQASGGGGNYTATSTATLNNDIRKIQVTAVYNNTVLTITSWKEIF